MALAHPFAYLLSNIFWVPWSQRNHQNDRQLVAVACCNTWLKEKDQVRPCGEEKTKANSLFTKVIIIFIFIIHFLSIYAVVDMEKISIIILRKNYAMYWIWLILSDCYVPEAQNQLSVQISYHLPGPGMQQW